MERNDKIQQIMDMVKQLTEEQTKEATLVVLAMRTGYELGKGRRQANGVKPPGRDGHGTEPGRAAEKRQGMG